MGIQEEQILILNTTVKVRLAPSSIQGVGVFAIMDIQKGQKLYCIPKLERNWFNLPYATLTQLLPEIRELILEQWPSIINGSMFLPPYESTWFILYMNHSDDANYDQRTDMALRDIKKGEEITENYRDMINHEKVYPFLKT